MRKNFGSKAILYPMPVLIVGTYDEKGRANAMNAAWGGISEEDEISICVDNGHKTADNVVRAGAFTVSIANRDNLIQADYVGIVSGKRVKDKVERCGWTVEKSDFVNAPLFAQLPLALECELKSYDEKTCRLVGKIINVSADESILDSKGKIDADKLQPVIYDPVAHTYRVIGEIVGKAFSDGKELK